MPIACINDPDNYGVNRQLDEIKQRKAPTESQIQVKLRNAAKGDRTFKSSNLNSIVELKQLYIEDLKDDIDVKQIRFFYLGKEMLDDLHIYSYDVTADMVIAVMIRPKPDSNPKAQD